MDAVLQEHLGWREAGEMCAACYLVSYSILPPAMKSAWFARATDEEQKVYMEWIKSANFRASQTGLYSCVIARNHFSCPRCLFAVRL